jgi:hypothetical protein
MAKSSTCLIKRTLSPKISPEYMHGSWIVGVNPMSRRIRSMSRGFGMTLHSSKDRYDMSVRDRWFALFIDPPIVEGPIRVNEESLFRWRCFSKCVGDIGTVDKHIFGR